MFAQGFRHGLVRSNWGRFEHLHARVSSWFAFAGCWWILFLSFTRFECADSSALDARAVGVLGSHWSLLVSPFNGSSLVGSEHAQ